MVDNHEALPEERPRGNDEDPAGELGPAGKDQGNPAAPATEPERLKITQAGPLAVVVFPRVRMHNDACIENYRRQLVQLLEDSTCQRLKFDVTGIPVIPSALLGLLMSVLKRGCAVEIYNPSMHVRETLEITKLDTIITLSGPEA